jgi:hypothetical protein
MLTAIQGEFNSSQKGLPKIANSFARTETEKFYFPNGSLERLGKVHES